MPLAMLLIRGDVVRMRVVLEMLYVHRRCSVALLAMQAFAMRARRMLMWVVGLIHSFKDVIRLIRMSAVDEMVQVK